MKVKTNGRRKEWSTWEGGEGKLLGLDYILKETEILSFEEINEREDGFK